MVDLRHFVTPLFKGTNFVFFILLQLISIRVMTADNVVGEKPKTEGEMKDSKEWSGGGGGGEGGFPKHQPPPQTRGYQR